MREMMNNKETFTEAMFFLAEVTGKNLSNVMFDFYYKDFEHSLDQATKAILEFAKDGKWPSINQIWERMGVSTKKPDDEDYARDLLPKIWKHMANPGGSTPTHVRESREFFTDDEWTILTSFMRWVDWCDAEQVNKDNWTTISAQFREHYKSRQKIHKYNEHLTLNGKANDLVKSLLDNKMQKLIDDIPF